MSQFSRNIRPLVTAEILAAQAATAHGQPELAFAHLERAHVLGQAATLQHVRVHWHLLRWGLRERCGREVRGQLLRLLGAATKTALGLVPSGNTGGANVSPFLRLPISAELQALIEQARGTPR